MIQAVIWHSKKESMSAFCFTNTIYWFMFTFANNFEAIKRWTYWKWIARIYVSIVHSSSEDPFVSKPKIIAWSWLNDKIFAKRLLGKKGSLLAQVHKFFWSIPDEATAAWTFAGEYYGARARIRTCANFSHAWRSRKYLWDIYNEASDEQSRQSKNCW